MIVKHWLLGFSFFIINASSLYCAQEAVAQPEVTYETVASWLKENIKQKSKSVGSTFIKVVQQSTAIALREGMGEQTEHLVAQCVSPRSSYEFPLIENATYSFIFKSYLRDFLHEFIPKHLEKPQSFFDSISFNATLSIDDCINQLEIACLTHGINPAILAQEFYYYKHIHGYKDRLKSAVNRKKSFFMILMGWFARAGTEVTIHSQPTLSWLLINSYNNHLTSTLMKISLETLLPTQRTNKGKLLWDYIFKVSPSTLQKAHTAGSLGLLGFQLHDLYKFIQENNILEKIKSREWLSFGEYLCLFLSGICIYSVAEGIKTNITSFEPPSSNHDSFGEFLQSYSR